MAESEADAKKYVADHLLENRKWNILKVSGFRQEYPNEADYPHVSFRLNISKHLLLSGVYLIVGEGHIEVWCLDVFHLGIAVTSALQGENTLKRIWRL